MFCFNCGTQVQDNSTFCYKCGTKLISIPPSQVTPKGTLVPDVSGKIDHSALIIYLHDVLTLEYILRKHANELVRLTHSIKNPHNYVYKVDQLYGEYRRSSASSSCFHLRYDGKKYYIAYVPENHYNYGVYTDDTLRGDDWRWMDIEANMSYLQSQFAWRQSTYPFTGRFEERKRRLQGRDKFLAVYAEFKATAPSAYQRFAKQHEEDLKKLKPLTKELDSAKMLRDRIYQCNIIPNQFRNIYAAYYLYDFISTSKQSLSTALLHFDLNEIKKKLDKIIEQQEEIIINQSIIISQNQRQLEKTQEQLTHLANIESNSERAAQYSAIAANNAEVCAWIGLANYLK